MIGAIIIGLMMLGFGAIAMHLYIVALVLVILMAVVSLREESD